MVQHFILNCSGGTEHYFYSCLKSIQLLEHIFTRNNLPSFMTIIGQELELFVCGL